MNAITNGIITKASEQWASRPSDERFVSLDDMQSKMDSQRAQSRGVVVSSRQVEVIPTENNKGLLIAGPQGNTFAPTNFAFQQLSQRADAPAGYLSKLPAPIAADCLNYGFMTRDVQDMGLLLYKNGESVLRAATGPNYGRVWNSDIVSQLRDKFGDGVTGDFRVPGEFGHAVQVTKENTTLYAGDRDMFVFLADETRRIEIPNRRDGKPGSMARGFFVWNSEVGSATLGIATFLFDYVCKNRIVWGATGYNEIKIRHTSGAPDRFIEEVTPALVTYAESSQAGITEAIESARAHRLEDKVDEFLAKRFGPRAVNSLKAIHELEEGRPIETRWDVITAVTAKARSVGFQNDRVVMERDAGDLLTA